MMKKTLAITALVACCGMAVAQDSVSTNPDGGNGLPGDAISPFTPATQVTSYVVDMAPLFSSWGTPFSIAPVSKTNRVSNGAPGSFFNTLGSGNSIAQTTLEGVNPASGVYSFWSQPGFGVSTETVNGEPVNIQGDPVPASTILDSVARLDQIAAHVGDFVSNTNPGDVEHNGNVAAIINFDPTDPNRLFVTRVVSAVNQAGFAAGDTAALGTGGIDAEGNGFIRADDFQGGAPGSITLNNWFRVRNQDRTSVINQITLAGGADATDDLIRNQAATHPVPAIVPADAGLPGGSVTSTNFDGFYKWGNTAAAVTANASTAHLQAGVDTNQRGNTGWFNLTFPAFGASVGTSALSTVQTAFFSGAATPDSVTRGLSLFGTAADGNITGQATLILPADVSDPCDPFTAASAIDGSSGLPFGPGQAADYWEFGGRFGPVSFRGSPGITGVGFDPATGKGLAANAMINTGQIDIGGNPRGALAVCRFDPNNPGDAASQEWILAGWADFDARTSGAPALQWGKPILDGPGGNVIGTMVDLLAVTQFGTPIPGPGISQPAFDAAGNIYFLTAAQLFKTDQMGMPFTDFDTVLVRGVKRDLVGGGFCYDLELILEPGQVFTGQNSGVDYQISFLGVATGSGGSSPATFWANSLNGNPLGNVDNSGFAQDDPRHMTGLILVADIVYDVDGVPPASDPTGSRFNDPTAGNGAPDSRDESYQVMLFINPGVGVDLSASCGPADITTDGACDPASGGEGAVTLSDFSCFLSLWSAASPFADITADGSCVPGTGEGAVTLSDFSCYLSLWSGGCDGDPGTPL